MEQASAALTQLLRRMQQQSAMAFTSDPKAASRDGKAGSIRPTALCRCLAGGFYPSLQGVVRLLRQSRRRVDIRVAPTGACAKPQSKLSPPPGSNFVVFSAAQCLYW